MGNLIVAVLLVVFTASALAFLFRDRQMTTRRLASVVIRTKGRNVRVWSRPELFAPQRAPAGEPLRVPPADPPAPAESGGTEARRALEVQR